MVPIHGKVDGPTSASATLTEQLFVSLLFRTEGRVSNPGLQWNVGIFKECLFSVGETEPVQTETEEEEQTSLSFIEDIYSRPTYSRSFGGVVTQAAHWLSLPKFMEMWAPMSNGG